MIRLTLAILLTFASVCQAGVYDTLEFGDNRATVTKKLKASSMVEQQMEGAFFGRTGLNGVFKCKAKLAGLTYHLYFNWSESGGLEEITLRSQELPMDNYSTALQEAWSEANKLFTKVYNYPVQDANYPKKSDFKGHDMLITRIQPVKTP